MKDRTQLQVAPGACPEEVAAITAAFEQFLRDTAPPPPEPVAESTLSAWKRVALQEGVSRQPELPGER